jgi:hypothetical protein
MPPGKEYFVPACGKIAVDSDEKAGKNILKFP